MSRISVPALAPDGYAHVVALERYLRDRLDPVILDLLLLRSSQLNGCAFCVDLHSRGLLDHGEPVRKVIGVAAWRESVFYSPAERAMLALAESLTDLAGGVPDDVWDEAARHFDRRELADLVLAAGLIAVWNRIGVGTHVRPPALESVPSAD